VDSCALCSKKKELKMSHIVPSFVGKWMKASSATGHLRGTIKPDKRLQDLGRIPLLCKDCEQRLSALETYFANEIFYPFFENEKRVFKYDSRLARFIISLNWRSLIVSYDAFYRSSPNLSTYVDRAEEAWRKYLLGRSNNVEPYENHIFFFDYVEQGKNLPWGFQWYTLRAVDATLVGNEEKVLAYSKFPWMIFVSSIHPIKLEGWENTRIGETGEIRQPQSIKDESFGGFLLDRPKVAFGDGHSRSLGKMDKRILKTIEKHPEKFLKSQSLEVSLAEAKLARDKNKERLPESVKGLIWIIEGALEDPKLSFVERQHRKFGLSLLADSLARMADEEASKIDGLLRSTIIKAKRQGEDKKFLFEGNEFVVVFMVNLYFTKDQQRSEVVAELDNLLKGRRKDDKRGVMVFSWSPFEPDLPYESAFYIGG